MPNRGPDWPRQAEHDLDVARTTNAAGQFDWSCFAAQQAAEKALKALYQHHHAEGRGHVLDGLIEGLLVTEPELERLRESAKILDKHNIPTRYPNGLERGLRPTRTPPRRPSRPSHMLRTSLHSVRHDAVPKERVLVAAREWIAELRRSHPEIIRVGYFGSYARGDYVPGSDFDVLIEVSSSNFPDWRDRGLRFRPMGFPVGIEMFVYTSAELHRLRESGDPFLSAAEAVIQWLGDSERRRSSTRPP